MNSRTFVAVIALVAFGLAGGAALAKPSDRNAQMLFEKADANGDGQVTRAELDALRSARFSEADADGDGMISLEELKAQASSRAEERAVKMMERLDADGDGQLSEEDMAQAPRAGRMFERLDRNDDGVITKAEFDDARKRMGKRHGGASATE